MMETTMVTTFYALCLGFALPALLLFWMSGLIRYVANDRLAVVEKLWSFRGSVTGGLIALRGEAGFQPQGLRGGFHFFFPFQDRLHRVPLVTIPQWQFGYVFARDGAPLPATQTLSANDRAQDFREVRAFLANDGQQGPQRKILREGTYALNLAQFIVLTKDRCYGIRMEASEAELIEQMAELIAERDGFDAVVIKDADDCIGVVTVHDGPALPAGEIIALTVGGDAQLAEHFHNNFQDPERFL